MAPGLLYADTMAMVRRPRKVRKGGARGGLIGELFASAAGKST